VFVEWGERRRCAGFAITRREVMMGDGELLVRGVRSAPVGL